MSTRRIESETVVKQLLFVCVGALGIMLAGCSKANASGFDPANPLHCAAQFTAWQIVARNQGEDRKAKALEARAQWYASRARSLPADQLTPEAMNDLGKRIAAQPDGGVALAKECWTREDADPEFQRFVRGG